MGILRRRLLGSMGRIMVNPAVLIPPLAAVLLLGVVLALPFLGVSGPEQRFVMKPGESLDSYLRIRNDGDRPMEVSLDIRGEVSGLVHPHKTSFSLDPGTSSRVALRYSVPALAEAGTYVGEVLLVPGGGVRTALSRLVTVTVAGSGEIYLYLGTGLNLVGWPGPELSFEEAFRGHPQVAKVWRRRGDGEYDVATHYPEHDVWWCPDPLFTGLETGGAYFLECESDVQLPIDALRSPRAVGLDPGTNLLAWTGPTMPVAEAFPQSSGNHPVDRVWKRNRDGSYSSMDYYPSYGVWWCADPGFEALEWGHAYFVEASEPTSITVPGVEG